MGRVGTVVIFSITLKFTISQVRKLYEAIYNKKIDVKFHKKIAAMPYVVALNEKQQNVSPRRGIINLIKPFITKGKIYDLHY